MICPYFRSQGLMNIKILPSLLLSLALLFNIQAGMAHDIEHSNYEDGIECEDCNASQHALKLFAPFSTFNLNLPIYSYVNGITLNVIRVAHTSNVLQQPRAP